LILQGETIPSGAFHLTCPAACGSAATAVVAALLGAAGSCADRAGVGRRKNKLDTKILRK